MNWHSVFMDILTMIVTWVTITACYYISKTYVISTRLKHNKKPTYFVIIATFIIAAIITAIISAFIGKGKDDFSVNSLTVASFIVLTLSSYFGLWRGYGIDSKTTLEQKRMKRIKEKEKEENITQDYEG